MVDRRPSASSDVGYGSRQWPSTLIQGNVLSRVKPFRCHVGSCDQRFAYLAEMEQHVGDSHLKGLENSCHVCNKVLSRRQGLVCHMMVHLKEGHDISNCARCRFDLTPRTRGRRRKDRSLHEMDSGKASRARSGLGHGFVEEGIWASDEVILPSKVRSELLYCMHIGCPLLFEDKESLQSHVAQDHAKERVSVAATFRTPIITSSAAGSLKQSNASCSANTTTLPSSTDDALPAKNAITESFAKEDSENPAAGSETTDKCEWQDSPTADEDDAVEWAQVAPIADTSQVPELGTTSDGISYMTIRF